MNLSGMNASGTVTQGAKPGPALAYLNVGWCTWLVLTELVRDAQAVAAVTEQQLREGPTMNYPLMIALGLLLLAVVPW